MLPIKHVLHPTDFSPGSDPAFGLACSLARDYGARLLVLHVAVPPAVVYAEGVLPPEPEESLDVARQRIRALVPHDPAVRVDRQVVEGNVVDEILRAAREAKSDVIVLGTHGRTGLGRLVMGSVAEEVARKAPCPVVTIKTPQPDASRFDGTTLAYA